MKKLKKLLSVVLAGAMALSLCATALASEDETPPVTSLDTPATGTIDAQSITQGGLPVKPISIILPTVPTRSDEQAGLFDFYLDPHELITKTEAARYSGDSFAPDTRLYFSSDEEEVGYAYSNTSQSLMVINTGFVDVDVDLDLEFDRGGADFDLVSSPTGFAANAAGGVRPQMYLAVLGGGQTKAVADPTTPPKAVIDTTTEGAVNFITNAGVKFEYVELKPTAQSGATGYSYGYTASQTDEIAAANAFYKEQKEALETALKDAELGFEYAAADSTDPDNVVPASVTVSLDLGDVDTLAVVYKKSDGTTATGGVFNAGNVIVEISATDALDEDDDDDDVTFVLATLKFAVAFPTGVEDEAVQAVTFDVPHTGAKIETALGVLEDSYKLAQTESAEEQAALVETGLNVTPNGYYWLKNEELADEDFPAFSFHLVGDINEALDTDDDTSPWDDITNGEESGITAVGFTMTWDVTPYDKTQNRTKLLLPAGAEPESEDVAPVVTVDSPATGTGTSTKYATLSWTAGRGAYAECVPTSVKSGNAAGTALSMSNQTANTFRLTASTTNKNSKCIVTFSDGTNSVDVEVDGWYTGT